MKIAIVQFYSYHEEILAPQIDFLLPDNELFIAAPKDIFSHDYIRPFDTRIKKIIFSSKKYENKKIQNIPLRILSILIKYIRLNKIVKRQKIELIVFNTINRPFHFLFIRFFFSKIEKVHIIHNAQLFISEKSAKPLVMFKKNLFISRDVYNYYLNNTPFINRENFSWFLPGLYNFFQPDNDKTEYAPEEKITIIVPGSVDDQRRNYNGLFEALKAAPPHAADYPIQIILLGKISDEKQKLIEDMGLGHIVKTYTEYISGEVMLQFIRNADVAAFLIDKTIGINCDLYNRYKATGTSVFCLTFGLPCIVSDNFTLDEALKDRALIYHDSHIESVLGDIMNGKLSKDHFRKLKAIPLPKEYASEYQRGHYRETIGLKANHAGN